MNDDLSDKVKKLMLNEVEAMSALKDQNEHLVDIICHGTADYVKPNKTREVDYIVLEIAERGILFDYISYSGAFNESLARYYFL